MKIGSAVWIAGAVFVLLATSFLQSLAAKAPAARNSRSREDGKQIFASNCAACHGLDGTGSERAPNIVTNPVMQRLSEFELSQIVSRGVPGTGMPAFSYLGNTGLTSVVAYVRSLQGKTDGSSLPGDPQRGEAIFFGEGQCSSCHMASGKGGFIGPDLAAYAQTHGVDKIRAAITNPAERSALQGTITAVTSAGEQFQGIVRNEDNFSLQLQAMDGSFHFLSKSDLRSLNRTQTSIMPSDYATRLNNIQMNDLISYLLSLGKDSPKITPHREEEE